jgi:hypothetical protein
MYDYLLLHQDQQYCSIYHANKLKTDLLWPHIKFHTKIMLQLQERENHTSHQIRHSVFITYLIAMPSNAHQEVVRLNISVDETFAVHILYTTNHLISQHKDCLNSKST